MRHLDLFSGIGGFALAARRVGWTTIAFCESEPFCQAVLRKHWPDVPIHPDVRELTADAVGTVDIITGGYPCQPFSTAGKRLGSIDDRHLWPELARLVRELRPRWLVSENVANHVRLGLDEVLSDLEAMGYAWEAFVIPACAVAAPHRRDRLWLVAHPENEDDRASNDEASGRFESQPRESFSGGWRAWPSESGLARVVDGIPDRLDRVEAVGNAVVPRLAEMLFGAIEQYCSGQQS